MWLPPPSSSPRKYSLPPASTDRCTRNRSSSTTTVTSQNWPHRYCETIATGSAVPPSRMAVGDGAAPGSVRARLDGRFDMGVAAAREKSANPSTSVRAVRDRYSAEVSVGFRGSRCEMRNCVRWSPPPPFRVIATNAVRRRAASRTQHVPRPHLGADHRSVTTGSAAAHGVRRGSRVCGVCGARARARYTTFAIRRHVS